MKKWKIISSRMAFDNRWFKVRQDTVKLPNGKIIDDYFVWPEGSVVMIVPVTKNKEFVLVKQYKHGVGEVVIEFPAGYVDPKESPLEAAKRELKEETGYSSDNISFLTKLTNSPTKVEGEINIYLAQDVVKDHQTSFDENEEIELLLRHYPELISMIINAKIWVSGTIAAAFIAGKKLKLS